MGRQLKDVKGTGVYPPTAELRKAGAMFTGVLIGQRMQDFGYGLKPVYKFTAIDADCEFTNGGLPVEAPAEGGEVEIISTTVLARFMEQAKVGETLLINGLGEGKKGKGKNAPWLFKVEVL